ncbi:MAG: hypothetical protein JWO86_3239 [Myxococcaceae bacterium]|nr:hypothetical protein [Myxococcaceae bacterium]
MTAKKSASVKTKAKKKTKTKATAKKATAKKAAAPKAKAKAKTKAKKPSASKAASKKVAAKPKPKAKAKAKAKATGRPKAKAKAAPKKKAATAKKRAARPASDPPKKVPSARPSDRAMEIVAQLPQERPLTDEEREAMAKCAQTALVTLGADGAPEAIVSCIGGFVDDIRMGRRPEPNNQDIRLGLGVLWGEQVRAQVGWRWVHLSYPNGFASYALVPDDRAFACFPLNRLTDLMRSGADVMNTSVPLFDSIRVGALPARRVNAYLVIG